MAVTTDDVAVELGRPAGSYDSVESAQWQKWIGDARFLIGARLGDLSALDQTALDYVVILAVAAHVRRPDESTQVDISVDDARVSRRYATGKGRVVILDEWWELLSPSTSSGAFSVDMVPGYGLAGHAPFCSLFFGGSACSCGLNLTAGRFPLYEDWL